MQATTCKAIIRCPFCGAVIEPFERRICQEYGVMCEKKNPGDVIADRYVITDILANHTDSTVYLAADYNEHQRWCSVCECQVIPEEGDPFCD